MMQMPSKLIPRPGESESCLSPWQGATPLQWESSASLSSSATHQTPGSEAIGPVPTGDPPTYAHTHSYSHPTFHISHSPHILISNCHPLTPYSCIPHPHLIHTLTPYSTQTPSPYTTHTFFYPLSSTPLAHAPYFHTVLHTHRNSQIPPPPPPSTLLFLTLIPSIPYTHANTLPYTLSHPLPTAHPHIQLPLSHAISHTHTPIQTLPHTNTYPQHLLTPHSPSAHTIPSATHIALSILLM